MDKYTILILLNMPFVIFGLLSAFGRFKDGLLGRMSLLLRLLFWGGIAAGIIFAENLYDFLVGKNLTDSPPLSLADVILVTGVSFCFFLSLRIYNRIDQMERRQTELQERLSIILSEKNRRT